MRRARNRWSTVLALSVVLACANTASAEGPGLKLGDQLVLHLGVGAELRYDSNVFFEPTNEVGALIFRALGSVDLATRPKQRGGNLPHTIDFRLHLGVDYTEFVLETQRAGTSQHRDVAAQAGLLLTLFPFHLFTADIFDNYVRTSQPPYLRNPYNLDRDNNELGLRLRFRPGGGRLEVNASYTFGLDFFEPQLSNPAITAVNVYYHRVNLHGQWSFFPKTAVYLDFTETPYIYANPNAAVQFGHSNSYPFHVIAGLNGLITTKLSLNGWIGYGNGFYSDYRNPISGMLQHPPNPNTAVGGLDIRWKPTMLSTGGLGYKHDFQNSLLGEYYDLDQVYISWAQLLWRFTATARLQYQSVRYAGVLNSGITPPGGPPASAATPVSRDDNNLMFDLRVDYPFKDWLIASVGYSLQYNNTDARLAPVTPGGALVPLGYTKHEPWLRLAVLY
jgi:hypothetical protein